MKCEKCGGETRLVIKKGSKFVFCIECGHRMDLVETPGPETKNVQQN